MKNLKAFIEQQNRWNAIFGKAPMNFNGLTQKEVNELARDIDAKLSPENLHCDGEISAAEANRKYRGLMAVVKDLEAYCTKYGYNMPYMYEA